MEPLRLGTTQGLQINVTRNTSPRNSYLQESLKEGGVENVTGEPSSTAAELWLVHAWASAPAQPAAAGLLLSSDSGVDGLCSSLEMGTPSMPPSVNRLVCCCDHYRSSLELHLPEGVKLRRQLSRSRSAQCTPGLLEQGRCLSAALSHPAPASGPSLASWTALAYFPRSPTSFMMSWAPRDPLPLRLHPNCQSLNAD